EHGTRYSVLGTRYGVLSTECCVPCTAYWVLAVPGSVRPFRMLRAPFKVTLHFQWKPGPDPRNPTSQRGTRSPRDRVSNPLARSFQNATLMPKGVTTPIRLISTASRCRISHVVCAPQRPLE